MTIHVRAAEAADLDRIGELTVQAYLADELLAPEDDYVAELRDAARRAEQALVLAAVERCVVEPGGVERGVVEGSVVVGTVTVAPAGSSYAEVALPGEAEIRMLAVDPRARGRGVGELLARAAIERGRSMGARTVILSTMPAMRTAQRMYARLGLHRVEARDWPIEDGQTMLVYSTAPS